MRLLPYSALPIQSRVSNLKSLAQVVLKICSIVCQKLQGSHDLGHAYFQGNYLYACSALPIQSRASNLKSVAQVVLEICSIVCQKLQSHVTEVTCTFRENYMSACSALSIQSRLPIFSRPYLVRSRYCYSVASVCLSVTLCIAALYAASWHLACI